MAMQQFLNDPDDVQWCKDVHLSESATLQGLRFASFVIIGNEDSPEELHLYADADPHYQDQFIRVTFPDGAPVVTIEGFDTAAFIGAYVECALWSSCGPEEEPYACENLDDLFGQDDLAPECMESMRADCLDFIASNASDLLEYVNSVGFDEARAGHDFWLTRCGHGAGFWDRGLGDLGDRLTASAKVYGNVDLYPGDDGRIYC